MLDNSFKWLHDNYYQHIFNQHKCSMFYCSTFVEFLNPCCFYNNGLSSTNVDFLICILAILCQYRSDLHAKVLNRPGPQSRYRSEQNNRSAHHCCVHTKKPYLPLQSWSGFGQGCHVACLKD